MAQTVHSDEGVGNEPRILVSGCTHGTVGNIVRGSFTLNGENHGKPSYKKDTQADGLDVMLYFWDDRDGANFCGWWFGPKIGGDQVWAYHPSRTARTPPRTGWKVPYDGPVDATFIISGKAQAVQAQQNWAGTATNAYPQHLPPGQQVQKQQNQQMPGSLQQPQVSVQQMALKRQQQAEQLKQLEQMRTLQPDLQRAQFEENRRKLEQQRVDQVRKQQEDLRKRQEEERHKMAMRQQREAELATKREEQRATLALRRVIQKLRVPKVETFDELVKELDDVLNAELDNCGSQKFRMKEECDSALEQAKVTVEKFKQEQKLLEERRAEEERKQKEIQEKAEKLLAELDGLVKQAEDASDKLKEEAAPLFAEGELAFDSIAVVNDAVDEASKEAKNKMQFCTTFILTRGAEITVPTPLISGDQLPEKKQNLAKLLQRINETTRSMDTVIGSSKEALQKATKKAAASKREEHVQALFNKYDIDKDGLLSKKEIVEYAKAEFSFTVPGEVMDMIFKTVVQEGQKGVKKTKFQALKVSLGVAREIEQDNKRRAHREEKEQKLAEMKGKLEESIKESLKALESVEASVGKAEQIADTLPSQSQTLSSEKMVALADTNDGMVQGTKEDLAKAKAGIGHLVEGVEAQLHEWLNQQIKQLDAVVKRLEPRLTKLALATVKFREDAKTKEAAEVHALERKVISIIKNHQQVNNLSNDAVFETFDSNSDGNIDETEFLTFFRTCERMPHGQDNNKTAKIEEGDKEQNSADADGAVEKKDEIKVSGNDFQVAEVELKKLFGCLDEEHKGFLSKDKFTNLIRLFMKVARDTVITGDLRIKESKTMRRLEVGEVVEVIEGPIKEESVNVLRVRAKVMKDGLQGWITLAGNQGTIFLEEGGNLFKVVKETILTESFELQDGVAKQNTQKLKDTTRKLKEGEILEVREWPRKDGSGLLRMKCRCKSDGATGWVTTVGNQGTVYLEVL